MLSMCHDTRRSLTSSPCLPSSSAASHPLPLAVLLSGRRAFCSESALVKGLSVLTEESQNHRMFRVGRDLCGSPSPTPLPKQGHPEQAAEDRVQMGLGYLQRRRLHSLSGQPRPGLRQESPAAGAPSLPLVLPSHLTAFHTICSSCVSSHGPWLPSFSCSAHRTTCSSPLLCRLWSSSLVIIISFLKLFFRPVPSDSAWLSTVLLSSLVADCVESFG